MCCHLGNKKINIYYEMKLTYKKLDNSTTMEANKFQYGFIANFVQIYQTHFVDMQGCPKLGTIRNCKLFKYWASH